MSVVGRMIRWAGRVDPPGRTMAAVQSRVKLDGKLFIRDGDRLWAYSIAAGG